MYTIRICSFLLVLVLSACTNNKKQKPVAKLITHITEDGIKKFQVVLVKQGKKPLRGNNKTRRQNKGPRPDDDNSIGHKRIGKNKNSNQAHQLSERIEQALNRARYCREGFVEIDRYSEAGKLYFNGQCNELASKNDGDLHTKKSYR